jgi:signal peptidase II
MKIVALIAGAVVLFDQITKWVALDRLPSAVRVDIVHGVFALTLVMNPGLAFGLLGNMPPAWRWLVAALSLVALGVLARVALRVLPAGSSIDIVAIGLIFGGAVGNLIDRARYGAVVDFIDVYFRSYHWPAFNIADSAITIGVAMMALRLIGRRAPSTP